MKNHRNGVVLSFFVTFFGIILLYYSVDAADYYGILQFTDPNSGLTRIVFQKSENKKLCETLNDNFWRGVKSNCPHCVKDSSAVSKSIPPPYKGIYHDKPISFPYLSSKEDRVIFLGIPISQSIEICKSYAQAYRSKLNRPAKAIIPIN